ncbi:MFS transporter [Rouxiella badensis]|uniref:MFS transporter n=1 Tax=Rouxiella badensis TaxID=1646377 RepID=UPI001CE4362F|nr:MFS transporter [Rouxiella badensis]
MFASPSAHWCRSLCRPFGRKRILLISILCFAVFSMMSTFARTPMEMGILRFLTGLGLGAVMPNTVTLVPNTCRNAARSLMITVMYSGFNIGSGLGGFIAAGCCALWLEIGAVPRRYVPLVMLLCCCGSC